MVAQMEVEANVPRSDTVGFDVFVFWAIVLHIGLREGTG